MKRKILNTQGRIYFRRISGTHISRVHEIACEVGWRDKKRHFQIRLSTST